LDGAYLPVDLCANAASLGAHAVRVDSARALHDALEVNRSQTRTTVFAIEVDKEARVPGYESWWDVPVAEVSDTESVRLARRQWEQNRTRERLFL
jgi:3D-(3,5/4)-trihydroxycyclohexane-1,2-dione acylhydrolase (decyclizing)